MPATVQPESKPAPPKRLYRVHVPGALKAWVLHDDRNGLPIKIWTRAPFAWVRISCFIWGHGKPPRAPHDEN